LELSLQTLVLLLQIGQIVLKLPMNASFIVLFASIDMVGEFIQQVNGKMVDDSDVFSLRWLVWKQFLLLLHALNYLVKTAALSHYY
jgi:predicted KAP-like P-loop ATPase